MGERGAESGMRQDDNGNTVGLNMMSWFKPKPLSTAIYCTYCGTKLVPNTRIHHYDPQTGKPIQKWLDEKICPMNKCGYQGSG